MKITIMAITSRRASPYSSLFEEYEARIQHYFDLSVVEVPPARGGAVSPENAKKVEGEVLLSRIPKNNEVFAVSRKGKGLSSTGLAQHLRKLSTSARSGATFLIGGANGLPDEVLAGAHRTLSLSAMTLPHELARLLLTEQVYRAGTILRGEPYHKGGG